MQSLNASILTAAMLVHATLGCCIHHAHSCETDYCETPTENVEVCSCSVHDEDHHPAGLALLDHEDDREGEQSHHETPQCEGGKCNLARTEASPDGDSTDIGSFSTVLVSPANCVAQIADRPMGAAASFQPEMTSATPRMHLVLAVVLI